MAKIHSNPAIVGLLALFASASCAQLSTATHYDQSQAEAEIREIRQAWAQVAVTGDPAVIERIFADDFIGVSPEGVKYTKREFIDDTKANPLRFTSIELDEMSVRFIGNMAVAQGRETFTRQDGERGCFVWTDVLERRDGSWQIIAAEDVMVPAAEPQSKALFLGSPRPHPDRLAIEKTRHAYVSAWKAASTDRITELYTDDALVLYPNQPAVIGRNAIRTYFKSFFDEFAQVEFDLTSAEVVVAGAWAFDRGAYRWKATERASGSPIEDSGKYLVVLERQADGQWKVARDMDNSDRAATQATRGSH